MDAILLGVRKPAMELVEGRLRIEMVTVKGAFCVLFCLGVGFIICWCNYKEIVSLLESS
jgi:hypothetical protein